jgi:LTXXQ motif family protein
MWKIAAAGVTALFVSASPFAYAQSYPAETRDRLTAAEWKTLTDLRIDLVKGALQLTPDQTKYWAAVEEAIRTRAKDRQARIENIAETVGKRAGESPMEVLRNRDPVSFLNRRADALAQRSADLRKLADAWQPLYGTLSSEQKRRMGALGLFVLRDMSDAVEQRRFLLEEDD